jgi:hypothetical protein
MPGHVATSRGALPGGSCCCRPRSCQRRQRHAGLAESPSQSSVFLYVSMVKIVGEFRDTQPPRQASSHRDAMCGHASVDRASAKPVPHASLGLRIRGARRSGAPKKMNYRPRRITRGSSRKVRDAWLGGRYRWVFCAALGWRVPGGLRPRAPKAAPCPSLTADRFEASHCPAPVAGERQSRPRSHDHGHAVHPFIAPPGRCRRSREGDPAMGSADQSEHDADPPTGCTLTGRDRDLGRGQPRDYVALRDFTVLVGASAGGACPADLHGRCLPSG